MRSDDVQQGPAVRRCPRQPLSRRCPKKRTCCAVLTGRAERDIAAELN
jgi:hypothetical protein